MELIFKIFLWLGLGLGFISHIECQLLRGANLIVTTVLETPYTMLRDDYRTNLTGNERYEGYIIDLVDAASKMLEFNYVLKLSDDNKYGSKDHQSGKWSGMMAAVVSGRAHVAAGSLTITRDREAAVDFTHPFMNLGIGIIHKRVISYPGFFGDWKGLLHPFMDYATDSFLLIVLIIGIVLILIRRKHKSLYFRTLFGLWLIFLFVFASLYIAQLSAYYIKNVPLQNSDYLQFSTIEEVASQSKVIYGCIQGGSTYSFFRNSNNTIYANMWSRMQSTNPSPFVANNDEGIERVKKGDYAFLMESPAIDYVKQRLCDLYQIDGLINSKGFGLAVQSGSSIRDPLNLAILELEERGTLAELKHKWWVEKKGGNSCVTRN